MNTTDCMRLHCRMAMGSLMAMAASGHGDARACVVACVNVTCVCAVCVCSYWHYCRSVVCALDGGWWMAPSWGQGTRMCNDIVCMYYVLDQRTTY
jgi:hypothetical protein